jgi:rubrerythrin
MAQAERLVAQLREELSKLAEIELPNIDTKDYDKGETIRAVRQSQIAELDAVNTYDQMAQSTSDPKAKKILQDVSDEEKVHQGEFEAITDALDPKNKTKVDDGKREAEEKTGIEETIQRFHSEFPELNEANPIGAAAQSLGKSAARGVYNAATKVPIAGNLIKGVGTALGAGQQPATQAAPQATAPAPQQQSGKGLMYGIGSAIGNAVQAGIQAHQANKAPVATPTTEVAPAAPSGLEGFEVSLDDAFKAIQAFANDPSLATQKRKPAAAPVAPAPAKEGMIRSYDQLLQELSNLLYEGAPADPAAMVPDAAAPTAAAVSPRKVSPDIQRLQRIAQNFCKQAQDVDHLKKDDHLLDILSKFVQEVQTKGITIKGLEKITPQQIQAAADQEKQVSAGAEQQVESLPDDQLAQLIQSMDHRALAALVKQAVKNNPGLAQQLIKSAPQQQQSGGRRLPAQTDVTNTVT